MVFDRRLVLAHNLRSRAEVDALLADVAAAGAEISQPARETFYGGYAGLFATRTVTSGRSRGTPASTLGPDGPPNPAPTSARTRRGQNPAS